METPLKAIVSCSYKALRKHEISVEQNEIVDIVCMDGRFVRIRSSTGKEGLVPAYFLNIHEIPGETTADQLRYRREWYSTVDGCRPDKDYFVPLTMEPEKDLLIYPNFTTDGRPEFFPALADVTCKEEEDIVIQPNILSPVPFHVVWRGPAIEKKRANIQSNGASTRLLISKCIPLDAGPYSLVAENQYGVSSCAIMLSVRGKPDPPTDIRLVRIGPRAIRLEWKRSLSRNVSYCIEYKRGDMSSYMCAAVGINATKVSLRHFRPAVYLVRVIAYTVDFRSKPSEEFRVDFSKETKDLPQLSDHYNVGSLIGEGKYSNVFSLLKIKMNTLTIDDTEKKSASPSKTGSAASSSGNDNTNLVAKVYSNKQSYDDILSEISILRHLHHPSLPEFHGFYETDKGFAIITKKVVGKSILLYINEMDLLTEEVLQRVTRILLETLCYLHDIKIMHLDVKPSNILVGDTVTLLDFGCAQQENEKAEWKTRDKVFSAPERLKQTRPTTKADVWSLGAVLCQICFGQPPHKTAEALLKAHGRFSLDFLSFLNHILCIEPGKRISVRNALKHPWILEAFENDLLTPNDATRERISRSASFDWS